MFNKVILAGNLARDIEIRYLQSGTAVATTAIAVNRKYKAQSGEMKDETMFIDITFWGRTAEIANQYLRKGSQVLIEGRLTLEQWTATDGSKRSKHTVAVESLQMLGGKEASQGTNSSYNGAATQQNIAPAQQQEQTIPEIDINDDEIPF
ncbi:MAG: single-stranded DNA-binding protein [Sulfurovaceae bacterium]|nr:single-stranded DNA-binding protein [Sulfurovaceae bacterium]